MLLRIIDNHENDADTICIVLESDGNSISYVSKPFCSPFKPWFQEKLDRYFLDYAQHVVDRDGDDEGVTEKLIRFGKHLGDELLGEDMQLLRVISEIEKKGYPSLDVQIESSRTEFFSEPWETLILHDSRYVLSATVRSFVRRFTSTIESRESESRESFNKGPVKSVTEMPVKVLNLVSRPQSLDLPFTESKVIPQSLSAREKTAGIEYEIRLLANVQTVIERLKSTDNPVNIVHYDGPLVVDSGEVYLPTDHADELLSVRELCHQMIQANSGILCIDPRVYLENNTILAAAKGLALTASIVQQSGIGNFIAAGCITNPWFSALCFEQFYIQLARGLNVNQAVVEARKTLQASCSTDLFTAHAMPLHLWPILVHYSLHTYTFPGLSQQGDASLNSQQTDFFQSRLYGFKTEMLPPLLKLSSDGQTLKALQKLDESKRCHLPEGINIIGDSGAGKTLLAHLVCLYLAKEKQIDFGFYFDFSSHVFSESDILEMVSPLIFDDAEISTLTIERLAEFHLCFVFDGVDRVEDGQPLKNLVETLFAQGHKLILVGESSYIDHAAAINKINTLPLSIVEQKIIAAQTLREFGIEPRIPGSKWTIFLESLNGNPWITNKAVSLLKYADIDDISREIVQQINFDESSSLITQFYTWQWASLDHANRRLLLICSEIPALLLEMPIAILQRNEEFQPSKTFLAILGDEKFELSKTLDKWESSGFVIRLPHGRFIDSRCQVFLNTQRASSFSQQELPALNFAFSQVVCEGIYLLCHRLATQPNPSISNNLLFNRRSWARHFEALWFNRDFKGFFRVKSAFDQLLAQARLEQEGSEWSLNLLERSALPEDLAVSGSSCREDSTEAHICWLSLASSALSVPQTKESEVISHGAKLWRSWIDSRSKTIVREELSLFHRAVIFLEIYYKSVGRLEECIEICTRAYETWSQYEVWQRVIQSLKSLSWYYSLLGDSEKSLDCEHRMLSAIPYESAPPGYQSQQMVEVLLARVSRGDVSQAQALMEEIRALPEDPRLTRILDGVQSEILSRSRHYSPS